MNDDPGTIKVVKLKITNIETRDMHISFFGDELNAWAYRNSFGEDFLTEMSPVLIPASSGGFAAAINGVLREYDS